MKRILLLLVSSIALIFSQSCTKYNLVDTGEANGNHDTTMWEYFVGDPYNWSMLTKMIEHADMKAYFDGTQGKDFTFFGPTNHSIRRYLFEQGYTQVTDIPQEECKTILSDCLLIGRKTLSDFKAGRPSIDPDVLIGTGGENIQMLSGKELWIYTFRSTFNEIPEAGPEQIFLVSELTQKRSRVASSNITTLTGIVHSLDYSFTITDL